MNASRMIWFGRYEGWLRMVANGVRDGDSECILKAAQLFDAMLPDKCIVIPMPSHTGRATTMYEVAKKLRAKKSMRVIVDMLQCNPHESNYSQKKDGVVPRPIMMGTNQRGYETYKALTMHDKDIPVFVIDNVICSGVTASAALHALKDVAPNAIVCTLAYSTWR